jgi:hypothetical protein
LSHFFVQAHLDHNPILYFLLLWEWQACTTMPSFFLLRWGLTILPISARIMGMNRWHQAHCKLLYLFSYESVHCQFISWTQWNPHRVQGKFSFP